MVIAKFKYLKNYKEPYRAFMELAAKWGENLEPDDLQLDKWVFYHSFSPGFPKGVMIGEHQVSGPREPALIWSGTRWFSSEDDLTPEERALAESLIPLCPGGLPGWS